MSTLSGRFTGMAKAEVKAGRIPSPNLGKAAYLVSSVRMHDSRNGDGFRAEIAMTCLWSIAEGQTFDKQESPANRPGDKVSICFFSGDRFLSDFKDFCLKAVGKQEHEEMDITDSLCPKADYPTMPDLDRLRHMWENVLPGMVCATAEDGSTLDAGVFDGQVIVEIGTTQKQVHKKIDKKKPDTKENWVHDAEGQPVSGIYSNSYINRRVSFQEAGEQMEEADILRFFGTTENFMELLEEHG